MQPDLATLVAAVPDKAEVYAADLAAAKVQPVVVESAPPDEQKSPEEIALDGVAYHVFNTLRGVHDQVPTKFESRLIDDVPTDVPVGWASFEEVRALVEQGLL